jgi:putative phage-type endonuclease
MLTNEEIQERRLYIGSSDVAAILGLNPYRNATDVWMDKTGRVEPEVIESKQIDLGNMLEPVLVQAAADTLQDTVEFNKRFYSDWRTAQVDGWLVSRQEVIEAKAVGLYNPRFDRGEWGSEGTDEIPLLYLTQVLWQMHVSGAQNAYVTALIGGGVGHRLYHVPRNQELIDRIEEHMSDFWHNHVTGDVQPEQTATLETYKRVIREPDKVIQLPDHLYTMYETASEEAREAETKLETIKATVLQAIGDAEVGTTNLGRFTYRADKRGRRVFRFQPGSEE